MKNRFLRPCGCGRPMPPPAGSPDHRPLRPDFPCAPQPPGGFLMQRILAFGRLHHPRQCYSLRLAGLPCQALAPFTVTDAAVCAPPRWEEMPCRERGALLLRVTVPLTVRVQDGSGCVFTAESALEEQMRLRMYCPDSECWRGQIFVQAAVRLCGRCAGCCGETCDVPLEVMMEGYVLASCAMGRQEPPCCPDPRPLYPQPRYGP